MTSILGAGANPPRCDHFAPLSDCRNVPADDEYYKPPLKSRYAYKFV